MRIQGGGPGFGRSMNKAAGAAKAVVRKGAWTHEEDVLLRRCIEKYGEGKWRLVPQRAGLMRCRKSCRLRWLNYLRPHLKRGEFAEDEIDLILRVHKLLGNRWALIAGRIPGRTANDIKNYWNAHIRKTLAAKSSRGTEAAGGSCGVENCSGKMVQQTTRPMNYHEDTAAADALPTVAGSTPNKATTISTAIAFTVIKPQPRTLTASIGLAMPNPAAKTMVADSNTDQCSLPAQISGGRDVHVPESSISPTPPTSEDRIMMWWDSVLEGLVRSSDEQAWGSGSEGDPPAESLFRDEVLLWGEEGEQNSHQRPCAINQSSVIRIDDALRPPGCHVPNKI